MNISQLMTKVSLCVALVGTVIVILPSASYAFGEHRYYYQNDDSDGTAWDYYRGYFSNDDASSSGQATRPRARTQTQRTSRRGAVELESRPHRPGPTRT